MSSPTRRLTDRLHQTFDTVLEDTPVLLLSMVAPDHLLLLLGVAPLVWADQRAAVVDPDLVIDDPNGHRVTGQTVPRVVPRAGEVDPAVAVDPADVLARQGVLDHLALERPDERRGVRAGETEPLDRCRHPERLVRPKRVIGDE